MKLKEILQLNESKETFNSFKKDFDDSVMYAGVDLDGNIITIYLDDNPNKEKNIINKLVRTKYSSKIKKLRSEDDVMKFKIVESSAIHPTDHQFDLALKFAKSKK